MAAITEAGNDDASLHSRLSGLPPELRNAIWIYSLALFPELLLHNHDNTTDVVARVPLIRVNQQIRSEVSSLLPYFATDLLIRITQLDIGFGKLPNFLSSLDKQTLKCLDINNPHSITNISASQLRMMQTRKTLRHRKHQSAASALLDFPSLRTVMLELSPNDKTFSFRFLNWQKFAYYNNPMRD